MGAFSLSNTHPSLQEFAKDFRLK